MPSSGVQTCALDRKSTRLNSSHTIISYAVFCLKKINEIAAMPRETQHKIVRGLGDQTFQRAGGTAKVHVDVRIFVSFFFNDTATTEIYTLSLHDALPI